MKQKMFYSFFFSLGAVVILLFSMMLITPVSGAYLTWKATAGPHTLAMGSDSVEKMRIEDTATPEPIFLPTQSEPPVLAPATVVEIELTGAGVYNNILQTFEVNGEACVRNSGSNATDGISPLHLQVFGSDDWQNIVLISENGSELMFEAALEPGSKQCFHFRLPVKPDGMTTFTLAANVTINNFEGWLPGTGNCPQQIPCSHGPVVNSQFTLPAAPTATPDAFETPPPPTAPTPTVAPTQEIIEPTLMPTETSPAPAETPQLPTPELPQVPTDVIVEPEALPTEAPPPPTAEPPEPIAAPTEEPAAEPITAPGE